MTVSASITGRELLPVAFGTPLGYIHCPDCIDNITEYQPYYEGNSAINGEWCDRCGFLFGSDK